MCQCVYQYFYDISVLLQYVYWLAGITFLLDIDTDMTEICTFQFYTGISSSSILLSDSKASR